MRILLSILIAMAGLSCAQAQSPRIYLDQIQAGIFTVGKFTTVQDSNISTGKRSTASDVKLERVTNNIPAKLDTVFGVRFRIAGSPRNAKVPLTVIWRYPEPGIKNPATGTTKFVDKYISEKRVGEVATFYWNLSVDYVLVPGTWTLEIWQGERQLLAQDFALSEP